MGKAAAQQRIAVCLLSSHPVVLAEWRRQLVPGRFRVQVCQLQSPLAVDLSRVALPRAQVYVVDALALRTATEALVAGLVERIPGARLVVAAETLDEAHTFPLLRLGAKGVLSYGETRQRLRRAVEVVGAGGFWVPRSLLSRFVDSLLVRVRRRALSLGPLGLSGREQEVLRALLENLSNKEIASKLNLSERTIKFHVSNLLEKFGVRRRADLILHCVQERLLTSEPVP